ncbi:MAG TPA: hypothetical protein VG496_18195 [Myxococcales bacterium]|nr:hypothetical protein [Myxococcales bacterium]
MLTLTRLPSVPFPRLLPLLQSVPLPTLTPFYEVRDAVERDMRGLWAGVDALGLHELSAANDETLLPEPAAAPRVRTFRPPLGWISLAAAGALFATLGYAQIQLQRHLSPTVQQAQKPPAAKRKHKKVRRVRQPERTDYSRGT